MKKLLSILLVAVMMLSLLAGCAQETPTTPNATPNGNNNTDATKNTEISFITWRSEDADVYKQMIADFESKNPGIKVNLEITTNDITEYYTVLKSRLLSSAGADVVTCHPGPYLKELVDAGYLMEMDADLSNTLEPSQLGVGQIDGKQYALTSTSQSFTIFYNKALFNDLGITVPTDYASLVDACAKSTDAGYMPVAAGFGEAWVTEILYEALMCSYANGNANVLHDLETGAAKLTDQVYQNVFGDVLKMVADGVFQDSATGTGYEGSISLFASGKSTMLLDGTWSVGNLKELNPELDLGLARIFSVSGNDIALVNPGQLIGVNAKSEKQEAAKKFVAYLFSVEGAEMYCNGTLQPSSVVGTALDIPELDLVSELMSGESAMWPDIYVENAELMSILDDLCARLAAGDKDLMAELTSSQAEIDAMMAE